MKTTLLTLSFLAISFDASAIQKLVGKAIKSPLKEQVCHLIVDGGNETCSGIRIDNDYVLTAQHCMRNKKKEPKKIEQLTCDGQTLEVDKVYESKAYADYYASESSGKLNAPTRAEVDFSVIKVKNANPVTIRAKLLSNLDEYKSIFLETGDYFMFKFAENTTCEIHGYGMDQKNQLDNYNSANIMTTSTYRKTDYHAMVSIINDYSAYTTSPFLPLYDKREDWQYSVVKPGDSGGPLFCKAKTGEWFISGVASTLSFAECAEGMQYPKRKFFESKLDCGKNTWGLPTKEALEKIVEVKLP